MLSAIRSERLANCPDQEIAGVDRPLWGWSDQCAFDMRQPLALDVLGGFALSNSFDSMFIELFFSLSAAMRRFQTPASRMHLWAVRSARTRHLRPRDLTRLNSSRQRCGGLQGVAADFTAGIWNESGASSGRALSRQDRTVAAALSLHALVDGLPR